MDTASGAFRLLVIKPKMIGDTLLLTPALEAVRAARPDLDVTLLVRSGSEAILHGTSSFDRVWVTQPPDSDGAEARGSGRALYRRLWKERFDLVVELTGTDRGRYLALLARSARRVLAPPDPPRRFNRIWRLTGEMPPFPQWGEWHTVRRDWEVLRHALRLPDRPLQLRFAAAPVPDDWTAPEGRQAVVHPVTRVEAKAWPEERWADLLAWMATRYDRIVLSTGPAPAEVALARRLAAPHRERVRCTEGRLAWPALAGVLQQSAIFVGVDTAAMHLAAACGTPTVAIWGPSKEHLWAPWTERACLVIADEIVPIEAARDRRPPQSQIRRPDANRVATVQQAIRVLSRD